MSNNNARYPRIRELREEAGLTQAQVAKELGCTLRAYRRYEGDLNVLTKIWGFLVKCVRKIF